MYMLPGPVRHRGWAVRIICSDVEPEEVGTADAASDHLLCFYFILCWEMLISLFLRWLFVFVRVVIHVCMYVCMYVCVYR